MGNREASWFSFPKNLVGERPIILRAFVEVFLKLVRWMAFWGGESESKDLWKVPQGLNQHALHGNKSEEKNIIIFN